MVACRTVANAAIFSVLSLTAEAHPFLPSNIGSTINKFYKENPYKGAFLTCSIKGCSADLVAQFISSKRGHRKEEDRRLKQLEDNPFHSLVKRARGGEVSSELERKHKFDIDWSRSLVFILYGGFYQGMVQEFNYNHILPMLGTGTDIKTVARKVAVDMGFTSPFLTIPTAYVIKGLLFGNTFAQSLANYVDNVMNKGLMLKFWMIFVPVQCITFSVIPEHFRVSSQQRDLVGFVVGNAVFFQFPHNSHEPVLVGIVHSTHISGKCNFHTLTFLAEASAVGVAISTVVKLSYGNFCNSHGGRRKCITYRRYKRN